MIIFLTFLLLSSPVQPVVHFFYSPSCGHCMDILLADIPRLQARYSFTLKKYDIDILDNLRLLEKMEEKAANKTDDLPVVFAGDSVFYGPGAVREKLGNTLKLLAARDTVTVVPDTGSAVNDTAAVVSAEVHLLFFYQAECAECDRTDRMLAALADRYPSLRVRKRNIHEPGSKKLYETLAIRCSLPAEKRLLVPAVFIGDHCLVKTFNSRELESLIMEHPKGSPDLDSVATGTGEHSIIERFSRFTFLGILFAGLLDGVNPCAFATIVFFVSYLVFMGRRRRDIILMSVSFIASVFLCYLAIGIGAYGLLQFFARFALVSRILFLFFGLAAIGLGILSLYDFFVARKGDRSKMILQLPAIVKRRIHEGIKEQTRAGGIIAGSVAAGFLVSFLEFGCTGQIYLPTIMFMVSNSGRATRPLASLVLYNVAFTLPLALIAAAAILFTTAWTGRRLENKIPAVKLATAVLFFALGIGLLLSL